MHQLLHIGILVSTLLAAAAFVLVVLWPLLAETALPRGSKLLLGGLVIVGAGLLLIEWRLAH